MIPQSNDTQAPSWMDGAFSEAWKRASKIISETKRTENYLKYQQDPIGFCQDLFGERYTDDVIAVAESVRDNVVTIAKSANATGKTHVAARLALWYWSVYPTSKVFITAAPPLENLRHLLWGEIMSASRKRPSIIAGCKVRSGNQLLVWRNPDNFINGVAIPTSGTSEEREAKFSGKHAPFLFFIVDEGDAVPDEVYKGIESCMSGGQIVRLLIMFNPRRKSGPVYFKESRGLANVVQLSAFRHPNVITGENVIPGAVTRETTIRRINTWTRPLAPTEKEGSDCFQVPDFLSGIYTTGFDGKQYPPLTEGEWRKITEPSFSYMVLGDYPAQGVTQLISEEWIDRARTRWDLYVAQNGEIPPAEVSPIIGVDMAEFGTDSNVACVRYAGFVSRLITWNGIDVDASATKALTIYREKGAKIAMIDATGVGAGVAPSMARRGREDDVRAVAVKVGEKPTPLIKTDLGEFQLLRDQIWWALREWLRTDDTAMLPPDPMLVEELKVVSYEVSNQGKIRITQKDKLRELLKRSPDRADSLALTFAPFERARFFSLDLGE